MDDGGFLRRYYMICLIFFIFCEWAPAETPGGQAGSFLRRGLGARAIAMGNAFTGLAGDGFAGYYNPASLPFMNRPEIIFSFGNLALDRKHNFIGFSSYLQPRSKSKNTDSEAENSERSSLRAGLSLGWVNAGVDNIDARNGDGEHVGMLSNSENAFYFSFALRPFSFLAFGLTAKVVNNRFPKLLEEDETLSANGFGMDFGLFAVPIEKLSLGVVVKDVKTKYTWNTEKLWERGTTTINHFPMLLRFGAAYKLPYDALISSDAEFNEEQGWRLFFGGEIPYKNLIVARAGYNSDRFTFGFGLCFKYWKFSHELSYAYDTIQITPSAEQYFTWRILL